MLRLNYKQLIQDSILTFNYSYDPLTLVNAEDVEKTTTAIIDKLTYHDSLTVEYILKELIKLMKINGYNVINHYEEFKPINLVKLLFLLDVDVKKYYN